MFASIMEEKKIVSYIEGVCKWSVCITRLPVHHDQVIRLYSLQIDNITNKKKIGKHEYINQTIKERIFRFVPVVRKV